MTDNKTSIYVVQENEEEIRKIVEPLKKYGYDVCGFSSDGKKAIKEVLDLQPNFLITELVCAGVDGLEIIRKTKSSGTQIIVVSDIESNEIIKAALKDGAMYFMAKPVSISAVISLINDLKPDGENDVPVVKKASKTVGTNPGGSNPGTRLIYDNLSLDEQISKIFLTIGIPPHIRGYSYLREGIKIVVKTPTIMNNVTKSLYPQIAEKFSTSPTKAERAMRHAIESAWNRGRTDCINAIFGIRSYVSCEKPTNSEFIALIADKLILDLKRSSLNMSDKESGKIAAIVDDNVVPVTLVS